MEFQYRYSPYMMIESQQNSAITDEFEIGNDPFYAELARQVLLLTEEDEYIRNKNEEIIRPKRLAKGLSASGLPGNYFSWSEKENNSEVPFWLVNLWRNNGGGTGVFIPHVVVKSSRKNKAKKKNNRRGRNANSTNNSTGEIEYGRNFNRGPRGFVGARSKQEMNMNY